MDSQDIYKIIYREHIQKLKNLEHKNSKLLILFSGVSGSGKSYIAKILEDKYEGIRINNDDVRDIIRDKILFLNNAQYTDKQKLLEEYLQYLYERIPKTNGFLILDSSIDRQLRRNMEFASKFDYPVFIIRIDLSREILVKQIRQRKDRDPIPYLADLERQTMDHEKVAPEIVANFTITEGNFNRFEELFQKIDQKIVGN